jgi:hypothetical protein
VGKARFVREALFHPALPDPRTTILPVCALLGLAPVTRAAGAPALALAWEDKTLRAPGELDLRLLNGRCRDIRKSTVDAKHRDALGYGPGVDPRRHAGPLVEKSDDNAAHDGRVVDGPVAEPRVGCVYQRLVRSDVPGGMVEQLRVAVVGDELPLVYVKRRRQAERFASRCDDVQLADAEECLSGDERGGLLRLAAAIGLDFGDLDVLRDDEDGRVYVVDVANTPFGPPLALGTRDRGLAVGRLADAVERRLL